MLNKTLWLVTLLLTSLMADARTPATVSHIHGLTLQAGPGDQTQLLLGSHDGVYVLEPSGVAQRVSQVQHDFMAFVGNSHSPATIFASGHPQSGGNLGIVRSLDGGKTWQSVSDGLDGPVDFHLMAIAPNNSNRLFGDMQGLQRSEDGGLSWQRAGSLPEGTYSFALSGVDQDRLYAASDAGLVVSTDAGQQWQPAGVPAYPATLVHTTAQGQVVAFVAGMGLIVADERTGNWQVLNNQFGQRVPLAMAQSGSDPQHWVLLDHANSLWESFDAGVTWDYFIQAPDLSEQEALGQGVYLNYCASCHNPLGTGESYSPAFWTQENYIAAPSMDPPGHAWHHTDAQLAEIISFGSTRTARMPAWNSLLSDEDISNVIAYIKSLWTQRELDCQGPKHMSCM